MGANARHYSYVENAALQPVYFTGVMAPLVEGGNIHFALYDEQIAADGTRERVIVARLVCSAENWLAARDMTESELSASGIDVQLSIMAKSMIC